MKMPTQHHMAAAVDLLRYLNGTKGVSLGYGGDATLHVWSDSDFAGDHSDAKSTTGWVCTVGGGPVVWNSKKQSSVALSTCHAEFLAACSVVKEVTWLRSLLEELGQPQLGPTTVQCDNQSAIQLLLNHQLSCKAKNINVACHFVREAMDRMQIVMQYVPSKENLADIFTKPPSQSSIQRIQRQAGVLIICGQMYTCVCTCGQTFLVCTSALSVPGDFPAS
jgi:hypothetical protein